MHAYVCAENRRFRNSHTKMSLADSFENKFYSHTIHPEHSFPSLHSSQYLPPSLVPRSPLPVSLKKGAGLQETAAKDNKTRYNNTKQKPSYQG